MAGLSGSRHPLGAPIVRVAVALSLAFATIALAVGYWGVVQAPDLTRSPYDAAVIAASRSVPRGRILDRDGRVLAQNKKDANGDLYRVYAGPTISPVVGYASPRYGRAGLERSYDAELSGLAGDPLRDLDCASRIHVFGDTRRTETVTTNPFQDPACPRPFLNQLQDTPTIQASRFNRFTILAEGRKKWSTRI